MKLRGSICVLLFWVLFFGGKNFNNTVTRSFKDSYLRDVSLKTNSVPFADFSIELAEENDDDRNEEFKNNSGNRLFLVATKTDLDAEELNNSMAIDARTNFSQKIGFLSLMCALKI